MRGKVSDNCRIKARVIRADGRVEDLGVISGKWYEVLVSRIKYKVRSWFKWQQLLR